MCHISVKEYCIVLNSISAKIISLFRNQATWCNTGSKVSEQLLITIALLCIYFLNARSSFFCYEMSQFLSVRMSCNLVLNLSSVLLYSNITFPKEKYILSIYYVFVIRKKKLFIKLNGTTQTPNLLMYVI